MPRDGAKAAKPGKKFGRIDPFCWLPVVPALLVALLFALLGTFVLTLMILVLVVLLLAFDSWTNRPMPAPPRSGGTSAGSRDPTPSERRAARFGGSDPEAESSARSGPPGRQGQAGDSARRAHAGSRPPQRPPR